MSEISQEESFLIQSYALFESLAKLKQLEEGRDPLFMKMQSKILGNAGKTVINQGASIFGGQGSLLSIFYMLLVLPLEWRKNGVGDFDKLNFSTAERAANEGARVVTDTYHEKNVALRHFRNALAHGRVGWNNGNLVVEDNDQRNRSAYKAEFTMEALGEIAQALNTAIFHFIRMRFDTGTNDPVIEP